MPTFEITHPKTGQVVEITGDKVPTAADLEAIFARVGGSAATKPAAKAKPADNGVIDGVPEWGRKNPNLYGVMGAAKGVAAEGIKMAGFMGGEALGLLAGPAAPVVGTALGAAGYTGAKRLNKALGLSDEVVDNSALGVAKDLGEGVVAGVAGRVIAPVAKALAGKTVTEMATAMPAKKVLTAPRQAYQEARATQGLLTPQQALAQGGRSALPAANEEAQRAAAAAATVAKMPKAARKRAAETLTKASQLAPQEATNLANSEALAGRLGAKLTPAQMTGKPEQAALEQALATSDTTFAAALTAQDNAAKKKALDAITAKLGEAQTLPITAESQAIGAKVAETISTKQAAAKEAAEKLYANLGNPVLPTSRTAAAVRELEKTFRPGDEEVFPARAIGRVKEALQGPKPSTGGHGRPADPAILDASGRPMRSTVDVTKGYVGFQDLHTLRKDIGRQITDASTGANPNRELAMKLTKIKDAIDNDIETALGKNNAYVTARREYAKYANTYRTGDIGKILQKGRATNGLRLEDERVAGQVFNPSGAKGLIAAVGDKEAAEVMRPFVTTQIMKHAAPDGANFNVKRGMDFIQKHTETLNKLGLRGDALEIVKGQLPAEIQRKLSMKAPDPATGMQFLSAHDMRAIMKEYGETIKLTYGPETLQPFRDYNQLMGMIERKNVVPRGGNSNTAEKTMLMAQTMIDSAKGPAKKLTDGLFMAVLTGAGLSGMGVAIGRGSVGLTAFGSAAFAGRAIYKNRQDQIAHAFVEILKDATLNPSLAKELMRLSKGAKPTATLNEKISKYLATAGTSARLKGEENGDEDQALYEEVR